MKMFTQSKIAAFLSLGLLAFTLNACDTNQVQPEPQLELGESAAVGTTMGAHGLNLNQEYEVMLSPLNNSGVSGMATIHVMGDKFTVSIKASGLEMNQLHPQHIHGFVDNNKKAKCPGMEADTNGDGLIDLEEGLPFYGPVLLSLTPFQTAPDGTIDYMQTFDMTRGLKPMQNNVIVLHGLTVNGVYDATLPVACGEIRVKPGSNKNK
jgi:hypothetical protein